MQIFKRPGFGLQFWLLCLSAFLFFASFNMIVPELPNYITKLGGEEYKGLIIALFTLTAGLSRPFSGKLSDELGRIPVMVFGAVVCFICGFLYPVTASVGSFLFLRMVHGFSTGFTPTGNAAYIADIIPVKKRGEAVGILGLAGSLGMAAGPAVGGAIANHFSLDVMFYASSAAAMLSVFVLVGMKETLQHRSKFSPKMLKMSRKEIFEPLVLAPSITMMLTAFSFGIVLTIIPDFSEFLGIPNKGLFFTVFTIASLGIRFAAGRISDKYGRVKLVKVSTLSLCVAMACIGLSTSPAFLMFSAVLFGVANGMNSPTIFAWTIDLSDENFRGRAMATMYIALEIGIGMGAFLSGLIYHDNPEMFKYTFWSGGLLALLAFLYIQFLYVPRLAARTKLAEENL